MHVEYKALYIHIALRNYHTNCSQIVAQVYSKQTDIMFYTMNIHLETS